MSRPRAYQLIDSAGVVKNLSTNVDKPANEAQARPLAKLPAAALKALDRHSWALMLPFCYLFAPVRLSASVDLTPTATFLYTSSNPHLENTIR